MPEINRLKPLNLSLGLDDTRSWTHDFCLFTFSGDAMKQSTINSWRANIQSTLDVNYVTIKIDKRKAALLELGLHNGGYYLLTLEAGFDVEIVKVVASTNGILTTERGQQGTLPNVWPAGTPIEARITAKTLDDLRLDLEAIINTNAEVLIAPNGDIITKVLDG